jgi:hypothetical protein
VHFLSCERTSSPPAWCQRLLIPSFSLCSTTNPLLLLTSLTLKKALNKWGEDVE